MELNTEFTMNYYFCFKTFYNLKNHDHASQFRTFSFKYFNRNEGDIYLVSCVLICNW